MSGQLKVLLVSSEVVPFAKTGGLADVAGALPKVLRELGHDVRVFLPYYRMTKKNKIKVEKTPLVPNINVLIGKE